MVVSESRRRWKGGTDLQRKNLRESLTQRSCRVGSAVFGTLQPRGIAR